MSQLAADKDELSQSGCSSAANKAGLIHSGSGLLQSWLC
uniref:Uncharacterized protein n=1 Tax=Anguilla anguilla TaxID=7936 RepID=A0A0E9WDP4_ANGAN